MNPYTSVAVLVAASGSLFALPLIPAMLELKRKSDAQPLSVIQQHTGEIRHFADSFRAYIKELEPVLQRAVSAGATISGVLPDKTEYMVLASGKEALRLPVSGSDEICPVLIATALDLSLPPDSGFSKDIYVGGRFRGGTKNRYRAVLGEREVELGAESHVMRWIHAGGQFTAGIASQLHGRVSSDSSIQLSRECTFQRLNAPRIECATQPNSNVDCADHSQGANLTSSHRLLYDDDFEIAAGKVFRGDLVTRGILRIGPGAQVWGDVKGGNGVVVEKGARLEGSLMSASTMQIGPDCAIHGPIIAEKHLVLKSGTRCGTADKPTTVSAPWIQVEEGVVVFGSLWARERGEVVARV